MSDLPVDDKYIVFKREDFYALMGELALPPYSGKVAATIGCGCECHRSPGVSHVAPCCEAPTYESAGEQWDCSEIASKIIERAEAAKVADAVVIRRQDAFAPPALDVYEGGIGVALELAPKNGITERLQEIRDYFHRQAEAAWHTHRKIPD